MARERLSCLRGRRRSATREAAGSRRSLGVAARPAHTPPPTAMANAHTHIRPASVGFHRRARGPTDRAPVNDDHPEESNPSEESNPGAGAGALGARLEGGGAVGTGGGAIGADAVGVGAGDVGAGDGDASALAT